MGWTPQAWESPVHHLCLQPRDHLQQKPSGFDIQDYCPSLFMLPSLRSSQFTAQNGQRAQERHQLLPRQCSRLTLGSERGFWAPCLVAIEFPTSFHPFHSLTPTINSVWCLNLLRSVFLRSILHCRIYCSLKDLQFVLLRRALAAVLIKHIARLSVTHFPGLCRGVCVTADGLWMLMNWSSCKELKKPLKCKLGGISNSGLAILWHHKEAGQEESPQKWQILERVKSCAVVKAGGESWEEKR